MDLSLVPIDELAKELENRCACMILAYDHYEDKKNIMQFRYGKGDWYSAIKLSAVLNNDVINNWNGELRTLQRINEEGVL